MRAAKPCLALVMLLGACVMPGASVSPFGRPTAIKTRTSGEHHGELLASRSDSLWILSGGSVRAIATSDVTSVTVERHGYDGPHTVGQSVKTGALTGLALLIACSTYKGKDGSSCPGVLPVITGVWTAWGSLFAISNHYSSDFHLDARDSVRLKGFARFPQGMPPAFVPVIVAGKEAP